MAGGLFSIDRAYFYEIGSYDSGSLCRFVAYAPTCCALYAYCTQEALIASFSSAALGARSLLTIGDRSYSEL